MVVAAPEAAAAGRSAERSEEAHGMNTCAGAPDAAEATAPAVPPLVEAPREEASEDERPDGVGAAVELAPFEEDGGSALRYAEAPAAPPSPPT